MRLLQSDIRRRVVLPAVGILLLCNGCVESSNDIEVLFYNIRAPSSLADPSLVHVRLDAGRTAYALKGPDFSTERYATLHSRRLDLPSSGELRVTVSFIAGTRDTLGSIRTTLQLQQDYRYGIGITPGGARPVGFCIGSVSAAPLRRPGDAAASDTLWVTVGGLPRDAVC